jgi:repressor LexA
MNDLTDRQKQVLDFMEHSIAENGYAPSVRDIADHLGVESPSTAHAHLIALEAKGAVKKKHVSKHRLVYVPARRRRRS